MDRGEAVTATRARPHCPRGDHRLWEHATPPMRGGGTSAWSPR